MRIRTHTNPFNYFERMQKINFASVFPNFKGKLDIEIGFGRGVFIRRYAKQYPQKCILGIEVRKNIVDILKERLEKEGVNNAYLIHGNGQICLEDMIEDNSIENLFIFHPDPWFKKKHHKRRVINKKFLHLLQYKIVPKGKIYISTDVSILWEDILEKIEQNKGFQQIEDKEFWDTFYKTHWGEFSSRNEREFNFGVWELDRKNGEQKIEEVVPSE